MENDEFELLRIIEQKMRDSGIVELVQSEVQNRPALWGQDDKQTCWLTSCHLEVCFNVRDQEQIAVAQPFLMLSIGTIRNVHLNMSVHGNTEYTTIYREKEIVHEDKRQR